MDFLYCLNSPFSSGMSNFTDTEEYGRVVDLLVKLRLSNLSVMVLGRTVLPSLYFLSHTTEGHNVISQLHFRFTLIISNYVWCAGQFPLDNALNYLSDLRYVSLVFFFSSNRHAKCFLELKRDFLPGFCFRYLWLCFSPFHCFRPALFTYLVPYLRAKQFGFARITETFL